MKKIKTSAADHAVQFISNLTLTGEKSGEPFRLLNWQEEAIRKLFGTLTKEQKRQFTRSLWFIPRKGGKTELAAAIVLLCLFGLADEGQEIVSAAADREQAGRVFKAAAQMVRSDPYLANHCIIRESKKEIELPHKFSTYKALSADSGNKDGRNISFCICDEIHSWKQKQGKELWDVLGSSFGARSNPLFLSITTAGVYNPNHFAFHEWQHAMSVKENPDVDPSFLPIIYQADTEDDWTDEKIWHKAMPGLKEGCPKIDFIRSEFNRAKLLPSEENKFRRYYLNQWINRTDSFFDMEEYDNCPNKIDMEKLKGAYCIGGFDGSITNDVTAFVLLFNVDGVFTVLPYFWIPSAKANERTGRKSDVVDWHEWKKQGFVRFCEGKTINTEQVRAEIKEIIKPYKMELLGLDPLPLIELANELEEDGLMVRGVRQGLITMTEPTRKLQKLILDHKINHGGNPVLRWMAENTIVKNEDLGCRPAKTKSKDKIDGISALLTALAVWIGENPDSRASGFSTF